MTSTFVAAMVLVLSILQLGNLPVSITGIVAASSVLCGCCGGPDGGCAKCCFIACSVLAAISCAVSLGIGGFMLSGQTCSNWEQTWSLYLTTNGTSFSLDNCASYNNYETYPVESDEYYYALLCYVCTLFSTLGYVCLVVGLALELPLCLLCAKAGCCSGPSASKASPEV